MADATDLKSVDPKGSCGFESRHRYQVPERISGPELGGQCQCVERLLRKALKHRAHFALSGAAFRRSLTRDSVQLRPGPEPELVESGRGVLFDHVPGPGNKTPQNGL